MQIAPAILQFISEKAGCDIATPSGAAYLRDDIESRTGCYLSLNTVKRLTGVLPYESTPRRDTLDIVARYVGCQSWMQLVETVNKTVSDFNSDQRFTDMSQLPVNSLVEITWSPDRRILLEHLRSGQYKVVESVNSKLSVGDTLKLSQVAVGFPLLTQDVIRDGSCIGPYTAASRLGIESFKIL